MSAAQAAKQSQFETETPLPTAGLPLELLPGSSRLDANGGLTRTQALALALTLALTQPATLAHPNPKACLVQVVKFLREALVRVYRAPPPNLLGARGEGWGRGEG